MPDITRHTEGWRTSVVFKVAHLWFETPCL